MYRPQYRRRKRLNKRTTILLASLALIIGLAVGTTLAYIFTSSPQVTNTFEPAWVDCEIQEYFPNSQEKKDIQIKNTGNVDAYIRVRLLYNWINEDDEIVTKPAGYEHTTVSAANLGEGWNASNTFYYYTYKVKPEELTSVMLNIPIKQTAGGGDYRLRVDVIAEAIQADPKTTAEYKWGINPNNLSDGYASGN